MYSHGCIYLGFWRGVSNIVISINTLSRSRLSLNPADVTHSSQELHNVGSALYFSKVSTHQLGVCVLRRELLKYALNKTLNHTNAELNKRNRTGQHLLACVDAFLENRLVDETSRCFESLYFLDPSGRGMPCPLRAPFPTRCWSHKVQQKRVKCRVSPEITHQPRRATVRCNGRHPRLPSGAQTAFDLSAKGQGFYVELHIGESLIMKIYLIFYEYYQLLSERYPGLGKNYIALNV